MRALLLAAVGLVAVSAFTVQKHDLLEELRNREIPAEAEVLTGDALAEYVNQKQKFFRASPSKLTMESMKAKLMDINFDSRTQWPTCTSISNIRDQSDCGACWAFGAAEAMSDRICIASNGKTQEQQAQKLSSFQTTVSADDVLSCCGKKCEGGYPIEAWRYWVKTGICTGGSYESQSGCKPYPIPPCGHHANETYFGPCPTDEYDTPVCTKKCIAGYATAYADDKHYGQSAYNVPKTVEGIQKEIMTNGPVEAAYTVYEDFYQYTGGVYVHTGGAVVGGHAVRILGWGVDNKTPYWLVANSWNTDWGENGYFRILRGVNECGIEHAIVAGLAKV
ncbi:unnamed protein product [Heligmosomoides polygyrus]|uniref:Pept_C1 domain-containing protein n=1 Tax=Heligmosomoides polygyrus TaxID=6339 RepID=A0A183GLE1_HELPZ|nr:unnamed protein product [Heligmosomoides polygyrus]